MVQDTNVFWPVTFIVALVGIDCGFEITSHMYSVTVLKDRFR